ncbi:MAG: TadE/TadG family type IV pilus assembly protein [Pseudomonadota bacterium]
MTGRNKSRVAAFFRDTSGAATLEFVVLVPFLMIVVFMFAEVGILTGRTVLMKRGVSIAARDIRLGLVDPTNIQSFRNTVCREAFLINSCYTELQLEIFPIDPASTQDRLTQVQCANRFPADGQPVLPATRYNVGIDGDIMIIKACLVVDPVFIGTGMAAGLTLADGQPGYYIIVKSAFMRECDNEDLCA